MQRSSMQWERDEDISLLAGPTTRVHVAWLRAPDFSWTRKRGSSFPHRQSDAKKSIYSDVTTFLDVQGQRLTTLLFTFYSPLKLDLFGTFHLIFLHAAISHYPVSIFTRNIYDPIF